MIYRISIAILLLLTMSSTTMAQSGGQFCVRSFEDRNANGTIDAGEPLLTGGVSADLLNAENVVVASALLSESPTAAQGVICFQFLSPGQYTMIVTSADYAPTTPNTVTAAISEGTLPTVVEYGGQRMTVETAADSTTSTDPVAGLSQIANLDRSALPRIVLSVLGSLVAVAGMIVLGSIIYLLFLRRPAQPQPVPAYYPPPTPTPGSMEPVDLDDLPEDDDEQS